MRVVFNNREVIFTAPKAVVNALDDRTAYYVAGFMFSPLWKSKRWDGKEHLLKKRKTHNKIPIGLLGDLMDVARAHDVEIAEVVDQRRRPPTGRVVFSKWNPKFQLRDYQKAALDAILAERGYETGKGLIRIPTRGGKSVVMAAAIHHLGVRAVVLVQSQMLLEQTVKLFEEVLQIPIGQIGKGVWDPGPVTVASCQTLTRRAEHDEARDLFASVDLVIFDEAHHLSGESWRGMLESIDAFYKVGFSATLYLSKKKENPKGTIWVRAVTGPVLSSCEPSDLIRAGWLIQPEVELVKVEGPKLAGVEWKDVYQLGIVEHAARNALVVDAVVRHHRAGLQVLVVTERIEHTYALAHLLSEAGIRCGLVTGETDARHRRRLVERYTSGELHALIGTVFGEAIDIPAIEAVVTAEGGKSQIAAMQRFRCLTPADGKHRAILTDFMDLHNPVLAKHSLERMRFYKEHELFKLKVVADG